MENKVVSYKTCFQMPVLHIFSAVGVQLWHPNRRVEITSNLNNFIIIGKLMELLLQMIFNFAITDMARVSLLLITCEELPSLARVDQRYVKLCTSPTFCLISMILVAACCLVLLTRVLHFSILISIPYAPNVLPSELVRPWSIATLPPRRSLSSAKCRFLSSCPPMEGGVE